MIKLIEPYINFDEIAADFREVFDSGWFTKGPRVNALRRTLEQYTGARHAHLTTSATTALSVCLRFSGVDSGDEVIVSDFSFPATANVVEDLHAVPVFADVDSETFNMRPEELEKRITSNTRAVIFVDAFGNPTGLHDVRDICRAQRLPLIEDAACGLGSSERGVRCGSIADLTCFSFHPRKLVCTGEGGAILTNGDEANNWLAVKLNHGATATNGKLEFLDTGFNYRLPELQAVLAAVQIDKLDAIIESRQQLRDAYIARLAQAGYRPQRTSGDVVHNIQSLVFVVPNNVSRDGLIAHLGARGIEATIGTYCLSGCAYYRNKYNDVQPISQRLDRSTITFPCHTNVDPNFVCDAVLDYPHEDYREKVST